MEVAAETAAGLMRDDGGSDGRVAAETARTTELGTRLLLDRGDEGGEVGLGRSVYRCGRRSQQRGANACAELGRSSRTERLKHRVDERLCALPWQFGWER